MKYAKLISLFSEIRLSKYLSTFDRNETKAISLYEYNLKLSQALYPMISLLEVGLRNAIDKELCKHFSDQNWLINKRRDFANHPNLTYKDNKGNILPDNFFTEKLHKAEEKLNYRKIPITWW